MAAAPFGTIYIVNDERCVKSVCTEIQASVPLSWVDLVSKGKIRIQGETCAPFNLILVCLILGLSLTPVSFHRLLSR